MSCLPVCGGVVIPQVNNDGVGFRTCVEAAAAAHTPLSLVFGVMVALGVQLWRKRQDLFRAVGDTETAALAFVRVHLGARILSVGQLRDLLAMFIIDSRQQSRIVPFKPRVSTMASVAIVVNLGVTSGNAIIQNG